MRKNKTIKWMCISGASLCIIGMILISIGFSNNATFAVRLNNNGFISIAKWVNQEKTGSKMLYRSTEENNSLFIEGNLKTIKIVEGEIFSIDGDSEVKNNLKVREDNGSIYVDLNISDVLLTFNGDAQDVVITVPKSIKTIEANTNVGEFNLVSLTLDQLKIECDMGEVNLQNMIVTNANINVNAGDINFQGDILSSINMIVDLGDIDVQLSRDDKQYNYDLSSDLGEISLNEMDIEGFTPTYVQSNKANSHIRAQLNAGDLQIETR